MPPLRTNDGWLYFGPGIGLINSFQSGMFYLGAGWNEVPIPSLADITMTGPSFFTEYRFCCPESYRHFEAALGSQFSAFAPFMDIIPLSFLFFNRILCAFVFSLDEIKNVFAPLYAKAKGNLIAIFLLRWWDVPKFIIAPIPRIDEPYSCRKLCVDWWDTFSNHPLLMFFWYPFLYLAFFRQHEYQLEILNTQLVPSDVDNSTLARISFGPDGGTLVTMDEFFSQWLWRNVYTQKIALINLWIVSALGIIVTFLVIMKMRRGAKLASSKLFRTRILLQWNSIQALILFPGAMAIFYGLLAPDGMRLQMWGGGGGFVSTLVPDKNVLAWPILRLLLNTINVYLYYCLIWTKYGYQTFYMPKKELQVKKSLKQDETSGEAMA